MKFEVEIGEFLKKSRIKAGLKQSDMARHMGCTPAYVHHVEHDLSLPRALLLKRYLKAVKLEPKQLKAHVTKVVAEKLSAMGV